MSLNKRVEKLEEKQPDNKPLTWKDLITMAREGKHIPGWDEFMAENHRQIEVMERAANESKHQA
jgi:hypothetical protein